MKQKAKVFINFLLFFFLSVDVVLAQTTASILPQGETMFFDNNGNPLSAGKVYFYIPPATTTLKTTWQDAGKTIVNTNPVILDAAGRAKIYGDGTYLQTVRKSDNTLVWSAITSSTSSSGGGTTGTGDGDLVATIKPWAGLAAPNQYAFAYGQEVSRTTYSVLFTSITLSQNVTCTSGNPTLTGLSDTSQIPIGAVVESICIVPSSTVISKTGTSITLNNNATLTTSTTAIIFIYGNGNGSTTFNLPDLRGYTLAGRTNMGGTTATNLTITGLGTAPNAIGAKGGNQTYTALLANLPPYTPVGTNATVTGTISQITPAGTVNVTLNSSGPFGRIGTGGVGGASGTDALATSLSVSSATFTGTPVTPTFTGSAPTFTGTAQGGTSTPFSIVQPTFTVNYIIKITPDTNSAIASGVTSIQGMTGDIACGVGLSCTGNIINTNGAIWLLSGNNAYYNAGAVVTGGNLGTGITTITSNPTLDAFYSTVLCDATASNKVATLPSASSSNLGWKYIFKKIDNSANTCTLSGFIDGSSSIILGTQYDIIAVQSNGSQWWTQ